MDINDINKQLSVLSKDFEKDLKDLDNKAKEISKKTSVVQNYLTNFIKDKCYQSFQYLEKNGWIFENDNDLYIKIHPKHKTERILSNFHKCLNDNDKDIRLLYSMVLTDQMNNKLDHISNIKKCGKMDNPTECFKNTISDTIYSLNDLYDNMLGELNNILTNRI